MGKAGAARRSAKRTAKGASALAAFLPCVVDWFGQAFAAPSPAQELAWPAIRRGENTLLLAPTGSGKTLAAFLCAIDDLLRRGLQGETLKGVQVLYITPLKALGNDIQKNLLGPLAEIRRGAKEELPELRVAVRSGDTPANERAQMLRRPPHLLITTPESLYLLLQSGMAEHLRSVRTVIVDEVHALCDNKRGVHLAVSLERLQEIVAAPLQRVGCSATLSPLDEIATFLVGAEGGTRRPCTIVDAGQRKHLEVAVQAPLPDFLEASNSALWASAYGILLEQIAAHRTTLVFCNSRYKAERTVLRLRELSGDGARIGVHHGSMSKDTRLEAEDDLKQGRLQALVATASLELGIDIGSVDLVYQLESPKSVATGLQRVGRAGHLLDATSKGRLLLFERDELMETAAVCRAMLAGEVDAIHLPRGCLDVLAQQIAGAVAAGEWQADELLALLRRAYPYHDLTTEQFESVLRMLAGEYPFRMARPPFPVVMWDRVTGRLSPARAASHVTAMGVGTIGETSEYDVVIAATNRRVGSVQSEFVDDSLRHGDVFVLGSSSWRVLGTQRNRLLVEPAPAATPTVPWWHGPIADRTIEVGERVGLLRRELAARLEEGEPQTWLRDTYHADPAAAGALVEYVREQRAAVELVPDEASLLVETWRDELGRQNIILHCPLGQRLNRTWGEALVAAARQLTRRRWSMLATNDLVLLTLGDTDAPPMEASEILAAVTPETLPAFLQDVTARSASFGSAFREAAVCSLQILRAWQGRRVPLWLQNLRAQELYEAAKDHPEYPVIAEVRREYQQERLDATGLAQLLSRLARGEMRLVFQQVVSPSPFAHGALVQDQYQDDHQMGRERRAHLLRLHRQVLQEVLSAEEMEQLLDPRAARAVEQRQLHRTLTQAQSSAELAQVIRDLGDLPATLEAVAQVIDGDAAELLVPLLEARSVVAVHLPECEQDPVRLVAADLWRQYHDAFSLPHARFPLLLPTLGPEGLDVSDTAAATVIPARWRRPQSKEDARKAIIARYLRCHGPVTLYELANSTGWPANVIEAILQELVAEGGVARGLYTSEKPRPQWVDKVNLEEIHRLTLGHLRRELGACAPREAADYMLRWQHVHPDTRLQGLDGLREVIRQLQGLEVMQGALESEILPGRIIDYRPELLDTLLARGEVCWRRLSPRRVRRGPITLCLRADTPWLASAVPVEIDAEQQADDDIPEVIAAVRRHFQEHHTAFFDDVLAATGCEEGAVLRAVWHLAWCGEVTCDTYECLRYGDFGVTLSACYDLDSTPRKIVQGRMTQDRVLKQMRRRRLDARLGRWSATERLVPLARPPSQAEMAARWADQLLWRWGIVTRDLLAYEVAAPPWSELVREFKRRELLGQVSRGYFIESHQGEQYGLPEAVELLRECRGRRAEGETGYLPGEPVLPLTNREPANLYASCLEVTDARGEIFPRHQRRGNLLHRLVVQAGQVLFYNSTQLVPLTRPQLLRALAALQHDAAGRDVELSFGQWNGYPIAASPVASVLYELGFREESRGMRWPSRRGSPPPAVPNVEVFPPRWEEAPPAQYGPQWALAHASVTTRPLLARLLDALLPLTETEGWQGNWNVPNAQLGYRGTARLWLRIQKTYLEAIASCPVLRVAGERSGTWRRWRFTSEDQLTPDLAAEIIAVLHAIQTRVDTYLAEREA